MSGSGGSRPQDVLGGGRYQLADLLGSGGMGLVYRAVDTRLERDVAVKVLADNLAHDQDPRERFSREARAAARISHPNVVQVYDVGDDEPRPYLVMELVDGPSLADVLRTEGPLSPDRVHGVAAQALAALEAAHSAGLLHRDMKPGNLMRSPDGTIKVTDFGVAEVAEAPGLTQTGMVIGTRGYLAPERFAGAPATPQTDLYALGATLLELLTGERPSADAAGPGGQAVPADGRLDTVPPTLSALIDACMSREPAHRPGSAGEASALLHGYRAPHAAAPATRPLPLTDDDTWATVDPEAPTQHFEVDREDHVGDDDHEADPPVGPRGSKAAVAVGVGVVLLLAALLALGGTEDTTDGTDPGADSTSEQEVQPGATEEDADEPDAPDDGGGAGNGDDAGDPAGDLRELGEWLRDQAG